jgi:rhodanese-related sulfurtransferase
MLLVMTFNGFSQENNCYIEVDAIEFQKYIDSCTNELIFDVRPIDAMKSKAIPNAISVPTLDELEKITDTLDRDTPILVYCVIGVRSVKVSKILCDKKFSLVVSLIGGIEKWKRNDFETEKINDE